MNQNDSPNTSRTSAFAEAIHAEENDRSAEVEAALDELTREAREQDSTVTREDVERLVSEALEHDPAGAFAQHFLETLQAEREAEIEREALPQTSIADQQEAVIDHDADPELGDGGPDYDDGPDFDDGGPDYG